MPRKIFAHYDEDEAMAEALDDTPRNTLEGTPSFTCNRCSTTGSIRWMSTHPCTTLQDIAERGGQCEDYPCCGHIGPDAGCAPQESHTSEFWHDQYSSLMARGYDLDEIFDMTDRED